MFWSLCRQICNIVFTSLKFQIHIFLSDRRFLEDFQYLLLESFRVVLQQLLVQTQAYTQSLTKMYSPLTGWRPEFFSGHQLSCIGIVSILNFSDNKLWYPTGTPGNMQIFLQQKPQEVKMAQVSITINLINHLQKSSIL